MTGEAQWTVPWRPRNAAERDLLAALGRNDRRAFFTTLTTVPLYIPQQVPDPATAVAADPETFVTYTIEDVTYLLVFTSVEALRGSVGAIANGYVETDFAELREKLPAEGVRLGFNMGTPVDAWMDVDSVVRAAAGEIEVPTGPEMAALLEVRDPANAAAVEDAVEQELVDFVEDFIDGLLTGTVLVPSAEPGSPWPITQVDGVRTIEVFTSPEFVPPGTATVTMPFTELVAAWPDPDIQLAVNPGTPLGFAMPGEVIEAFARSAPDGD